LQPFLADGSATVVTDTQGLFVVQAACDHSKHTSGLSNSISLLRRQFAMHLVGVTGKHETHADWSVVQAKTMEECDDFDLVWVAWGSSDRGVPCAVAATSQCPIRPGVIILEYLVGDTTRTSCKGKGGQLVKEIIKKANTVAKRVTVVPSAGFGSTVQGDKKLQAFYEKSGFTRAQDGTYEWETQQPSTHGAQPQALVFHGSGAARFGQTWLYLFAAFFGCLGDHH